MKFPARHWSSSLIRTPLFTKHAPPINTATSSTRIATRSATLHSSPPSHRKISTRKPTISLRRALHLTLSPSQRQTIYALATPPGKAGVAVIRVSGPAVPDVYAKIVRKVGGKTKDPETANLPKPRVMERAEIVDPDTDEILDDGLVVYFAAPKSFTTEHVLELHTHSGRAIISSILHSLSRITGCRPADPGEFTRRAFESGRLDLTQVEGLKDLIDAETSVQRKLALRAAGGAIRKKYDDLRERIIYCLAMVEAIIDFGEGEEIEDGVWEKAQAKVSELQSEIRGHLHDGRRGEILRNGIRLAIFGPPNAGKSSLLNFLAQREAAIVTPLPGTTRDVLEISLDIGGMPVIVADTAGLRMTSDLVESIGIERARAAVASADISLCVLSLPDVLSGSVPSSVKELITPDTLLLLNKTDLVDGQQPETTNHSSALSTSEHQWRASVNTGTGMKSFLGDFVQVLRDRFDISGGGEDREPLITQARHRIHLENALQYLDAFMEMGPENVVFAAEELRYATQEVGKVSGAIGVEDILDTVFKEFCIGK
ncbi:mitochondrial splicing system protein [Tulasnella sp. 408]|nr:mitochondrial splicing system protein [Tulasnella sp. 408]